MRVEQQAVGREISRDFRNPRGVCPGGFGKWLVSDHNNNRLCVLSGEGDCVFHLLGHEDIKEPRFV